MTKMCDAVTRLISGRPRWAGRRMIGSLCTGLFVAGAAVLSPLVLSIQAAEPVPVVPSAVPKVGMPALPITTATLEARFARDVKPLLQKHCYSCHANGKHKGEVALDPYTNLASVQSARSTWMHFEDVLKQKLMPPEDKPQPTQAEFDTIIGWIGDAVNYCDCSGPRDPGRVAIHRLNRTEYNNSIRDLTGVDFKPAKDFPADDTGYGFDNIADVLTMSPLLAERYLDAAEQVMDKVVTTETRPTRKKIEEREMKSTGDRNQPMLLLQAGDNSFNYQMSADGQYEIRVRAFQRKLGNEDAKISVRLDDKEVGTLEISGQRDKPLTAKTKFSAKAGNHKISLVFANPKSEDNPQTKKKSNRSITMDQIEVEGPYNALPPPPSPAYRRLFVSKPGPGLTEEAAARAILQRFASRAYRRPAQVDEVEGLMKVYRSAKADAETWEQGVKLALEAVLVSPQFLFRVELDPGVTLPTASVAPGGTIGAAISTPTVVANPVPYLISDYELATRLSYFLWSSTPDDELMSLASSKRLRDPKVLEQQITRMLQDSRSTALVENFAGQWLELRNLDDYKPDTAFYPSWDDSLKSAMKKETELYFASLIREDKSIVELLTGQYTFVNERLAKHYGIPNVKGEEFQKVSLAGGKRGGVLTQASILTVTAMPTRTSPVKRGKFILENILGTPPPPPPMDVPALSEKSEDISKATLKIRLEAHRKDPNCAVCHIKMDNIGFSLENFDAIGQWRDKDGKFPVDSVGKLPEGTTLNGAEGLRQMLLTRQGEFVDTVVKKLLTYSLGRGLEFYDQCTVKDILAASKPQNYKFSAVVLAIVKSDAFQKRRTLKPDEIRASQEKPKSAEGKKEPKKDK